jgi:GMP synthase (glutamine-hydrolysing)
MVDSIYILDFGSQYTQLIARRIRELNVYAEIVPYHKPPALAPHIKGIVLSGSPASVYADQAPNVDLTPYLGKVPVLGVCYGAQLLTYQGGGRVESSPVREYGRAALLPVAESPLFKEIYADSQVWMSHGDSVLEVAAGYHIIAKTATIPVAAFQHDSLPVYGLQFHPEVTHTTQGSQILKNFVFDICHAAADWSPASFVQDTVERLKGELGTGEVVCALSGGVDSTVAAVLVSKAIGERLHCIFVNNGLLRKGEYSQVLEQYKHLGLNITGVDASAQFLGELAGKVEPEAKRKTIGRVFIEVFEQESKRLQNVAYLVQGTIYPDVIESVSVHGPSVTIKSHHNVGGLPERMNMKVVEPLRLLFKDEVRRVGAQLGIAPELLGRHPFPGPGLAIRVLGEVTPERVRVLQEADAIFIQALRAHGLYNDVWQAFAVLLPVSSVGVMGDERTYENVLALRAVTSVDGMTADWAHLPYGFLAEVSNQIINTVRGVNRVVYDISSKPPATIEWE